ncbi:MAG: hypothetical protein ABI411_17715 [Tahibacter sp.]
MKKMSPYMLVRKASLNEVEETAESFSTKTAARRVSGSKDAAVKANKERIVDHLSSSAPQLAVAFRELEPAFQETLLDSCARSAVAPVRGKKADGPGRGRGKSTARPALLGSSVESRPVQKKARGVAGTSEFLAQITHELSRTTRVERIGMLDLGAWVAGLPDLLSRLNAAQDPYTLFEINAPVPAGLRKTAEGMLAWMMSHGITRSKAQRAKVEPHVIADEFFTVAGDIRTGMGLDMVVGLTPAMVAGDSGGEIYWNHYCSVSDGTALVSTADLREFAIKAGRPFEAAVGLLMVGAVLVRFNASLEYHANRGCVLDYNEDRVSLIDVIRDPKICPECAEKLDPIQKVAASEMLKVLRKMKRKTT